MKLKKEYSMDYTIPFELIDVFNIQLFHCYSLTACRNKIHSFSPLTISFLPGGPGKV